MPTAASTSASTANPPKTLATVPEISRDHPSVASNGSTVTTSVGDVRIKVAGRDGRILNAAPEFEDCVRLSGEHNLPAKTIQALAMKAWLEAGNRGL